MLRAERVRRVVKRVHGIKEVVDQLCLKIPVPLENHLLDLCLFLLQDVPLILPEVFCEAIEA